MFRPSQPQFKIRVLNGKVNPDTLKGVYASPDKTYIDIEKCVAYPVIYTEQADLLNTISFTVDKYADLLLYYFFIGQTVILYGGFYSDNQSNMQHIFTGTVTRIRTTFSNSGKISFSVECMCDAFTKLGKDPKNFVYPDKNSSRGFAKGDTVSLTELINGIAKENNISVGKIDLSTETKSYNADKINILYQKNETDWQFLSRLALNFGCTFWVSTENGKDFLNFVSRKKAAEIQSDITFLFPLYGYVKNAKTEEIQKFEDSAYNRPRILRDVTVDEDISQATSVSRSAMYFDSKTGEYKNVVSTVTEKDGKKEITFYELDEAKIEYIHRTDPKLADDIRNNGPTNRPWGDDPTNPQNMCYYYRVIQIYDSDTYIYDKAFFGITVTAKCNQDLTIHSQRSYKIRGILSYHSKDTKGTSFFLRGLSHIWDSDGTWTELDFIR